ncbi:hypothetical protein JAAARDRAFT_35905 [Jaapia argillacea MUCL 33604]|uniref:Uncharacterized protein n=1 Tax=Jaapia argillacea MUCL 33604 TaxID=933084 RepID=A0A067Q3V9_9AGAM|nr:hypothetical protein JAAARDRAFT_35905 [Jaapia argillacea MUCL 33604]
MHDNDPEVLEREKHRNLSGRQHETSTPLRTAPGWNESLASHSEASVKADKHDHLTPEEMQRHTVDYVQSRHHPEDRLSRRVSEELDSVTGPLSSASGSSGGGDFIENGNIRTTRKVVIEEHEVKGERGDV